MWPPAVMPGQLHPYQCAFADSRAGRRMGSSFRSVTIQLCHASLCLSQRAVGVPGGPARSLCHNGFESSFKHRWVITQAQPSLPMLRAETDVRFSFLTPLPCQVVSAMCPAIALGQPVGISCSERFPVAAPCHLCAGEEAESTKRYKFFSQHHSRFR